LTETPSAYFLIAHGSRDPRSRQGLETCAALVRQHLAHRVLPQAEPWVGTGVLEFGDQPLAEQLAAFTKAAAAAGVRQIFLLPLFLAGGNHVLQDLPEAIQDAQSQLSQDLDVSLVLCPTLGNHPDLSLLVQARMRDVLPCDRWILLAHGTKRPGGNQPIETLAHQLKAANAYWTTAPALEDQIQALYDMGAQRIGIAPYFLFAGRITDAIEEHVVQLRSEFTTLDLPMTQPLNPSSLLAQLLLDSCTAVSAVLQ
jgi:sirohydrochlorin cobaltochelatase